MYSCHWYSIIVLYIIIYVLQQVSRTPPTTEVNFGQLRKRNPANCGNKIRPTEEIRIIFCIFADDNQ